MPRSLHPARNGFSLIDLVVLLALLAFLVGFLMVAVRKVRQTADGAIYENNLHQLAIAMHNMQSAYGELPPLVGTFPPKSHNGGTLFFHALPFLEELALYNGSADKDGNHVVWHGNTYAQPLKVLVCTSDPTAPVGGVYKQWLATTNYAGNWQLFGPGGGSLTRIPDGTSATLMWAERYQICNDNPCAWGYPGLYYWAPQFAYYSEAKFQVQPPPEQCDPGLPQSFHEKGLHVALCDASVRSVANTLSPQTWWQVCTPAGGEIVGKDWEK